MSRNEAVARSTRHDPRRAEAVACGDRLLTIAITGDRAARAACAGSSGWGWRWPGCWPCASSCWRSTARTCSSTRRSTGRWSLEPAFGYYSKPPLIAWMISASTAVCGQSEFCIRLPRAAHAHGHRDRRVRAGRAACSARVTGFLSALAFATLPGISLSAGIISTDVPLLFLLGGRARRVRRADGGARRGGRRSCWARHSASASMPSMRWPISCCAPPSTSRFRRQAPAARAIRGCGWRWRSASR